MTDYKVVEICAGAGGQALGLEKAGFQHELAVEVDHDACNTLRLNRPGWSVAEGDVTSPSVWNPKLYAGIDLLAGGVPCPPFTVAGKQLGATDERDLFAWAVELAAQIQPHALMLENVRGLGTPRFSGYRQHVADRLAALGYMAEWRLLHASDYGVPQLRPRFILVALQEPYAPYFRWPRATGCVETVGSALRDLMAANQWEGVARWSAHADKIAPTIVGGSKKHGGPDLGPSRARKTWAAIGVDGRSVGNDAPKPGDTFPIGPRLTCAMVARLQGWTPHTSWKFTGTKTQSYRQIGNAFPPPVATALGSAIAEALAQKGEPQRRTTQKHDPILQALLNSGEFVPAMQLAEQAGTLFGDAELQRRIESLRRDFDIEVLENETGKKYKINGFKAFTGPFDRISES